MIIKEKTIRINDKYDENGELRPKIFVITHVGKYDIQVISEAIAQHYYLLSGDFEHIQGTIDNKFLNLNGALYFKK